MRKRVYEYRIRRIDVGKYQIEEQYRFMLFWKRWRVGSRRLPIFQTVFDTAAKASKAILNAAAMRGIEVHIADLELMFLNIQRNMKASVKKARKNARIIEERERNLRRIGKTSKESEL